MVTEKTKKFNKEKVSVYKAADKDNITPPEKEGFFN